MPIDSTEEARRQLRICNACRYCESFCAVFPSVHRQRDFTQAHITMLADLCHNCRRCYYACQYVEPHEFAINIPAILAEVREETQINTSLPGSIAKRFHTDGILMVLAMIVGLTITIAAISIFSTHSEPGFYALLPHEAMVGLFLPAFILPLIVIAIGLRRYWKAIEGGSFSFSDFTQALKASFDLRHLAGGHGDGCNFEKEDKFSHKRRWFHQATMFGFLLCFAATCSATILHYFFNQPAPYSFWTIPKLLGVPGGLLLSTGTAGLAWLKLNADASLGAKKAWGGEMAFILLLFIVSSSGLLLYWASDTEWLGGLLAIHLGAVLTFFVLTPYTKMVHGFYRLTALVKNAADIKRH